MVYKGGRAKKKSSNSIFHPSRMKETRSIALDLKECFPAFKAEPNRYQFYTRLENLCEGRNLVLFTSLAPGTLPGT